MFMKKLVLLLFVMISSISYGQQPILFEKVIQFENMPKDSIFYALKKWVATEFISAKSVIEMEDKDAGILVISPNSKYSYNNKYLFSGYTGFIEYNMSMEVREGRFKVIIKNFTHKVIAGNDLYGLGIITNSEDYPRETISSFLKKYHNLVWDDLKVKVGIISEGFFNELSTLNFREENKKEDNW